MEAILEQALKGMRDNGFTVVELKTAQEACDYLLNAIPAQASVGMGGSMSVRDCGVSPQLRKRGNAVHSGKGATPEESAASRRAARDADCYLCSANAVTRTGKLVLVDGMGNRTGAICDGPKQLFFIISHSKVVDGGINTAIARIKQTACPQNARRLGLDTPCAKTGVCSPQCADSMCRVTLVVERVPRGRSLTVLFVEESLGY